MSQSQYDHRAIEKKWQEIWLKQKIFKTTEDSSKENYYVLEMFIYPSGSIHMGHVRNYAIGDVIARHKKMQGFNVLHPMGWDAFGLPAENAAIENNAHPKEWTEKNIAEMKKQLLTLGFSYDWDKEINTSDAEYYKHEQKIFIDFFRNGLAYQKESIVNWDPVDNTVLANEQVIDGKGWRSGAAVEKKSLRQWFLKISDYADDLLAKLNELENWPHNVKVMQENWIGKSVGCEIDFKLADIDFNIKVFTTRIETIFGASFIAVSAQHELINIVAKDVQKRVQDLLGQDELDTEDEKIGVFSGLYAHSPVDENKKIPVYFANYVNQNYASGAVFGCPAHDQRDHGFAVKYKLDIIQVVRNKNLQEQVLPYLETEGELINSEFLDGLNIEAAKKKIISILTADDKASDKTIYRLNDWGISRQRFWGCPIPIIHCPTCGVIPVKEEDLPVTLPEDIDFSKKSLSLADHPTWAQTKCYKCGSQAKRETDTFDTFFESAWYFARFCTPHSEQPFVRDVVQKWLPVNQYIGGIEHAILHLLYARFFTKALRDCDYLDIDEPFTGLLTQGMICHETYRDEDGRWLYPDEVEMVAGALRKKIDGSKIIAGRIEKMSKSKKNTVSPVTMVEKYGADAVRVFLLSDSPPTKDLPWSLTGLEGANKYLNSLYSYVMLNMNVRNQEGPDDQEVLRHFYQMLDAINKELQQLIFNKVIAAIRQFTNKLFNAKLSSSVWQQVVRDLLKIMSLFVPHIAEELWCALGHKSDLFSANWPETNADFLVKKEVNIPVQINGKIRATAVCPIDCGQTEVLNLIKGIKSLDKYFLNVKIKRIIFVKNKIVNFVI